MLSQKKGKFQKNLIEIKDFHFKAGMSKGVKGPLTQSSDMQLMIHIRRKDA